MPELPEVETTCRGIAPHITGKTIDHLIIRNRNLRWPVTRRLEQAVTRQTIEQVSRRAKYILMKTGSGTLILAGIVVSIAWATGITIFTKLPVHG